LELEPLILDFPSNQANPATLNNVVVIFLENSPGSTTASEQSIPCVKRKKSQPQSNHQAGLSVIVFRAKQRSMAFCLVGQRFVFD